MECLSSIFKCLIAASALVVLAAGSAAAADTASTGAVLVYPASYFAGVQLNTAYDMVQRLPGFVFIDTDTSKRGYAGSAGNVLINGIRPSSKTDTLSTLLGRILASDVARIEVIRGGAPGIDMLNQSVVANVVLKRIDKLQIISTFTTTLYGDGHFGPGGSVEFTGSAGVNDYDVTLSRIYSTYDDSAGNGLRILTQPGQGTVTDGAHRRGAEQVGYSLNAALSRPVWRGNFAANLTLEKTTYNSATYYDPPGAMDFPSSHKVRSAEFGANWDRIFGKTELNLVALQRLQRDQKFNASIASGADQIFNSVSDTGESILRATVRYVHSKALRIESGLEGAYNFLNGTSSFLSNGAPVALPGANPTVNEKRGEASLQASWQIAPDWSLDTGVRYEFSTIGAQGIASRSFNFLKPRLLLSWSPAPGHQFRLRAERLVGQLDFSNFIASSDFASNGINAGNLGLKPDQRWQYEGDYEFHFWNKGALVLSYTREQITDLVDFIPIGNGLDGPGNIPKAVNNIYDVELSLPLDRLGISGGTLKPSLVWKDSAVRDPVTGETRQISNTQDRKLVVHFLEDIQAWHSSLDFQIQTAFQRPNFRIDQVSYVRLHPVYVGLTWDYKPRPGLDLQVQVQNFVPYQFGLIQYNYGGPRNVAPLVSIQDGHYHSEPRLFLQLRKTF